MIGCVVPISGGKDSQACLKLALIRFGRTEVRGLFCDTQFEHPLTYTHVDAIRDLYGVRIDVVSDGDVGTRCLRYGRFPSGTARFCTDDLKIKPTKRYLENLAAKQGKGFEVWYGMRSAESNDRAKRYEGKTSSDLYPLHEILPKKYPKHLATMGVMCRLPILDWQTWQVMQLLDGEQNPLYAKGFDRVGCFPCLASGDAPKERAFGFDETGKQHYELVRSIENRTGKSIWTSKGGAARNNPDQMCAICQS
jgi:3'-phosphoadenosine 5'-phosphosulfate sulfotransferase (PAPS reductase)/FAD synthetase